MFRFFTQAPVGSPMHTSRFHPKRLSWGPAQARSDLFGAACGSHPGILLLALIGQAKAAPAEEATVRPVKLRNPPVTILSRAVKPRPETTKMTFGPANGHILRCPFLFTADETWLKGP
jgi:hypothetical protein